MAFLDLSPVGSEGLHTDRPPYLRKWSKLENLIFTKGGAWRSRPGLAKLGGTIPSAVAAGEPSLIMEVPNPRSTTTSGGKILTVSQTLFPIGVGAQPDNGFTPTGAATNWEALDDNPPDGYVTKSRAALSGIVVGTVPGRGGSTTAQAYFNLTDVAAAFDTIDSFTIHGRVQLTGGGPINFRVGIGVGQPDVFPPELTSTVGEGAFVISGTASLDFSVTKTTNRAGGVLVAADLNDNELFIALTSGLGSSTQFFEIDWMNVVITGVQSEQLATTGLLGVSKVIVSDRALLEYNDATPSYIDRIGASALPTARPMDGAILYGQIFAVNGENQTYIFPNSAGNFYQLSGKPTGRTVATLAGRILVGWATSADSKTIPERVIYSVKGNGEDYTGVGSGFFDLLATPGGIVKLATFSDDLCMAYKEQGVWTIRRTGDDDIPFVPDVIDFETRCMALKTVKNTLTKEGLPIQLFLGRNSLNGLSVFRCDGSTTVDVGQGIFKFLNDSATTTFNRLAHAFAEVDPDTGNYWLFVVEGTDTYPKRAWILDMRTYEWTSAALAHQYSTAGRWTLATVAGTFHGGENKMILGKASDNLAYKPDSTLITDAITPGLGADVKETVTWETGDYRLSGTAQEQAIGYRLHLLYTAAADVAATISASKDGGVTYNTGQPYTLKGSTTEPLSYRVLDILPIQGRRIRFKVEVVPALRTSAFEIAEMWIGTETAGEDA